MVVLTRNLLVERFGGGDEKTLYGQVEIDLRSYQIDKIEPDAFANLHNLVYLWLNDNEIESIDSKTFGELKNLSRLSLHNNKLAHLDAYTFANQTNLTRLALGHNKLTTIDAKALHGLRNLEFVSFDNNRLEQIGPSTFAELDRSRVKAISLFENPSAFKSYINPKAFESKETTEWEKQVSSAANLTDYDEFLAQFLGLNTFKSY